MLKRALAVMLLATCASAEPFLAGRVTDARGGAAPGAIVSVVAIDPRWRAVAAMGMKLPLETPLAMAAADESGAFRIDAASIPAGLHALAFAAPGSPAILRWHERVAFGGAALPADLELHIPALAVTSGLVLDENGAIVAGAHIVGLFESATDVAYVNATSDATGRFELSVLQDATLTLVGSAGTRWGIVRTRVGSRAELTLALHLAEAELVEGVVVAQGSERPLSGIRIRTQAPTWDPVAPTAAEALPPWGDAPVLTDQTTVEGGRFTVRIPTGGIALTTSARTIAQRAHPGMTEVRESPPVRGVVVDDRGAPVVDADVRWTELPDAARTDSAGRFQLLPDTNALIAVTTSDGGMRSMEVTSIVQELRITLPALLDIRGQVRAQDAPASGVTVRATTDTWDVLTATDDAGQFALKLRGVKRLAARKGALAAETTPSASVVMTLRTAGRAPSPPAPSMSEIRVKVLDESGRPLAGALARAGLEPIAGPPSEPFPTAGTAPNGMALLEVEGREPHDILIQHPGHASHWLRAVRPGTDATARLQRGATLQGTIRDAAGQPIGGAVIAAELEVDRVAGSAGYALPVMLGAMSDVAGAYFLRNAPAGTHAIDVVAAGFASAPRQRVTLVAGRTTTLDVTLDAGATLRGLVHDATGPVSGAVVKASLRAQSFTGQSFGAGGSWRAAYTLEDGSFAIDGLEPEAWYDVLVTAEWHADASGGGRPSESLVDVAMIATGAITGEVLGEATDARVTCEVPSQDQRRSREDRHDSGYAEVIDGRFSIDALAPGLYQCSVDSAIASAILERVDVRAGIATPVVARLKEKPFILVDVMAADTGLPIAEAYVNLGGSSAASDASGHARLAFPAPPDPRMFEGLDEADMAEVTRRMATIDVGAEGYESDEIELPPSPPRSVTARLKPLPKIRGRVVDATGLPAVGAEIFWGGRQRGLIPTEVATDGQGSFELPSRGELSGDEMLTARRMRPDGLEEGSADLTEDPSAPVLITLARVEPAELVVLVKDAAGPVAGARVMVTGDADALGTTNAEGRFIASHLAPGEVSIMVETDKSGMRMRHGVQLDPGEHAQETIVLGEGWTIEGRVVSAGRPVEGAQINWITRGDGGFGLPGISRADGSFQVGPIPSEESEVGLMVTSQDHQVRRHLRVSRGDPPVLADLAVVMLRGRVLAGEAPVEGASARLQCAGKHLDTEETDDAGLFQIEAPGSSTCDVIVTAEGHAPMPVSARTIAEGVQDLGDILLESRAIRGHVSFPEGRMADELQLTWLTASAMPVGETAVSVTPDGMFEADVAPGVSGFLAQVDEPDLAWVRGSVEPGATLELEFVPGGSLEIIATKADGTPTDGYAGIEEWEGMGGGFSSAPIEAGRGILRGLASGHFVVSVTSDRGRARVEADVLAGSTQRLNVTLR